MTNKWIEAMKEELKSMDGNDIWDLVELPKRRDQLVVNRFRKLKEL